MNKKELEDKLRIMILQQGNGVSMKTILQFISDNFIPKAEVEKQLKETFIFWDNRPISCGSYTPEEKVEILMKILNSTN